MALWALIEIMFSCPYQLTREFDLNLNFVVVEKSM